MKKLVFTYLCQHSRRHRTVSYATVLVLALPLALFFCLSGCGKATYSPGNSPELTALEISAENLGDEESQLVYADLVFDRTISAAEDKAAEQIKVLIAGNRCKNVTVSRLSDNTLRLTVPVTAVTNGILQVVPLNNGGVLGAVTDDSGRFAVCLPENKALIPSGVVISRVDGDEKSASYRVDEKWSIRSIAWVRLWDDGEIVYTSAQPDAYATDDADLDGAVPVHGHYFLRDDCSDVAQRIRETLEKNFGDRYDISGSGDTVVIQRAGGESGGEIELEICRFSNIGSGGNK